MHIRQEVLRPGFFGSGVQLTDISTNDDVVALASGLLLAYLVALCWMGSLNCFKRVAFEKHARNGVTYWTTLVRRLDRTNAGYQKRN